MYEEYFGLKKKPFSIVPDPGCFYLSKGHREALAHLLYGIKSDGGFVLLTGEVGTGKTTVCRRLLEAIPEDTDVAFILNPKLSSQELLAAICDEFRIGYPDGTTSVKVLVDRIYEYLLQIHEKGRRAVLIIEEAQNLSPEVLEQIRLLTNLETNQQKLLQMIMLGQPELRDMLEQQELRQLSQRITARYHLGPLSKEDIPEYINYRLSVAGLIRGRLFPPATLKKLYRLTGGVPRLMNAICDRALLGAYVQGKERVDRKTLITAARELTGKTGATSRLKRVYAAAATVVVLACAGFSIAYYLHLHRIQPPRHPVIMAGVNDPKTETLQPPSGYDTAKGRTAALEDLFKRWQIAFDPALDQSPARKAEAKGLRFAEGRGSISSLREMNRPAVLRLAPDNKDAYYVTLIALDGDIATLLLGNTTKKVTLKQITEQWTGDYQILWKTPPGYKNEIKPGSKGAIVDWLARQLAVIAGAPAPTVTGQVYNQEMIKQIKRLQIGSGMVPDGIIGPKTMMRLTAAVPNGEPVLYGEKGTGE